MLPRLTTRATPNALLLAPAGGFRLIWWPRDWVAEVDVVEAVVGVEAAVLLWLLDPLLAISTITTAMIAAPSIASRTAPALRELGRAPRGASGRRRRSVGSDSASTAGPGVGVAATGCV